MKILFKENIKRITEKYKKTIRKSFLSNAAFTLIEMVCVVSIIGCLTTIISPMMVGYMDQATDTKKLAMAKTVYMATTARQTDFLMGTEAKSLVKSDNRVQKDIFNITADMAIEAVTDEVVAQYMTEKIPWIYNYCNQSEADSSQIVKIHALFDQKMPSLVEVTFMDGTMAHYPDDDIDEGITEEVGGCEHEFVPNNVLWEATENGAYSFVKNDNKWTSNNQGINSSTASTTWEITIPENMSYSFSYMVSSESASYDYMYVYLDGATIVNKIGGTSFTETSKTISLTAGTHTLKATYMKDNIESGGTDCGYLILPEISIGHKCSLCEIVEEHDYFDLSRIEPTCTEAGEAVRKCSKCNATISVVVPKLGHNFVDSECTRCGLSTAYGLFDASGNFLASYDDLVDLGFNVETVSSSSDSYNQKIRATYPSGTKLVLPPTITKIGSYAFYNSSLREIIIPNTVVSIGKQAFDNTGIESIIIPDSVTTLGNYCFSDCLNLTTITLSKNITSLPYGCFQNSGFASFTVPNTIKNLSSDVFKGCTSLTSVTLPDGPSQLWGTFEGCINLQSVNIPASVNFISGAFGKCWKLASINVSNNTNYIFENGMLMDSARTKLLYVAGSKEMTSFIIPDSVTLLDNELFAYSAITSIDLNNVESVYYGCFTYSNLTSINLRNVKSLAEDALSYTKLSSIYIPDSVSFIGSRCFKNCSVLTTARYSENTNITGLNGEVFYNDTQLKTIILPTNVKNYYYNALKNVSFDIVNYKGSQAEWEATSIHSNASFSSATINYNYVE